MEIGWNILWFIVGVSLLVTVHEFGHFWVARKLGFKVLRFSVGFGKPLYKRVGKAPDHTEFVIAAIPLGGYVRMLDEREGTVPAEDLPRAFQSKPPWQRILVMLAGPAANILFAILVLWGLYWINGIEHTRAEVSYVVNDSLAYKAGLRTGDQVTGVNGKLVLDIRDARLWLLDSISGDGQADLKVRGADGAERNVAFDVADRAVRFKMTEPGELYRGLGFELRPPPTLPFVGMVQADGPAAKAGLQEGDQIISVNGVKPATFDELSRYVRARPAQELAFVVRRDGKEFTRRITTRSDVDGGQTVGRIGVNPNYRYQLPYPAEMTTTTHAGPIGSLAYGAAEAWKMTVAQARFFARMITGGFSIKNMEGFISIAQYAGESARMGVEKFIMLLVLLSLSLGFLNLLPIPILDGGQIVFQLAEWVKGRPLSDRTYIVGQQAGLLLLVLLMGVALFNDLTPFFK
jgi:regulator of sigma E protease